MKLYKIVAAIIISVIICVILLCSCNTGGESAVDNSAEYGSPTEFEGDPHEVSVFFVNAGKADCSIVSVDGRIWLVDTGTEEGFPSAYAALELIGADSIDGVIISHGHGDHLGGLVPIANRFSIGGVFYPDHLLDSSDIEQTAEKLGLKAEKVKAGSAVEIVPGAEFSVLAPQGQIAGNDNDNSLVAMLCVNGRKFLFTGDMQEAEDRALVASGAELACDLLKVPNHGNPDACSPAFAAAASPLISIVSTDTAADPDSANSRVLARLASSEIYLTQKYEMGVLVTVSPRGEMAVSFPKRPGAASGAELTGASKEEQSFTVKNSSDAELDLTGWFVYSTKGYEVFNFPRGTALAPGQELKVACSRAENAVSADLYWDAKKVWADSKEDAAVLCDRWGNEICRVISE